MLIGPQLAEMHIDAALRHRSDDLGVIMIGYEQARSDRSLAARRQYVEEGKALIGGVPAAVVRSWQRCIATGHRSERPVAFEMIGRSRIHEIDNNNRVLVEAASAEVVELGRVVARAGMIVLLTDAAGVVVAVSGDLAAVSPQLRMAARKGVDMSETTIGTNAIGTTLVEREPLETVAREHYYDVNAVHTCTAAPLFAPDGRLIGALDVSGDYRPDRPNMIELVVSSARAIENRLLNTLPEVMLLSFSPRAELLGTPWEAVVAFDPAGSVVGANTAARGLLGLPFTARRMHFEDLFEARFPDAQRMLMQNDLASSLQSASGLQVLARFQTDVARVRRPAPLPRLAKPDRSQGKCDGTLEFLQVVSNDKATADAVDRARRAYDRGVPTLLVGETGTGKELIARALHLLGERCDGPFVAVNCASLPESLVEAELFGHVDGAFTGARRGGAQGRLELAHGGTLFLDEIGDMPLSSQAKLLRVLQERSVVRLGDTRERPIDIALVCATHQDLPGLIGEKIFREDLFYRVNGLCVILPPLRLRSNILDLAQHFLRRHSAGVFSPQATQLILSHPWQGNLRQLGNVITCAVALAGDGHVIGLEHFPEDFLARAASPAVCDPVPRNPAAVPLTLGQAESDLIAQTLLACGGNVSAAARALGVSRSTLYNKRKRG